MFTNKNLGIILIIIGIAAVALTFAAKAKEDFYINTLVQENNGTCVLESGYCLHEDRDWTGYIIGWVIGTSAFIIGAYLLFFDRSFHEFKKHQQSFATELRSAKKKTEFEAFLSGFSNEEQSVLRAIHDQDGIQQSTLRYRAGMSKAGLSILLNLLEQRGIISRKTSGKTKQVFLRKKF